MRTLTVLGVASLVVFGLVACKEEQLPAKAQVSTAPAAPWTFELVDTAFQASLRMPEVPHAKNRSKVQEQLALACLELGGLEQAQAYSKSIVVPWRRGSVLAQLACEQAERGLESEAKASIVAAERAVEQSNDEDTQDWQRGRVRGKLARAWLMLGNEAAAASYSTNLDPAEAKAVADQRVRQAALTNFEAQLQAVIGPLNSGNFEQIKAGLETAELLYAAVYAEADKRTQVDAAMRKGWEKMPLDLRIQALLGMATAAVDHADKGTARTLLDEARTDIDRAKWLLEHRLPVEARWSTVLGKAGDTDGATQRLAQAMELYERERANTVNIYRAGALRPIAEAYAQLGQPAQALVLYQRALEEGLENPNSRPRLDDLSATVISMAVQGVQPSADTRTRIQSIAARLGDPW
jgi:hypothetical protein